MAKKKKRGGAPQSGAVDETSRDAIGGGVADASAHATDSVAEAATAAIGDRFDPFSDPRARLFANIFIALFVAYQLGMPLRYYMGGRGLDERFSWRMFSSIRMLDCLVEVEEHVGAPGDTTRREVNLKKEVQVAWIGLLERGRGLVIEKLLSRRCDQEGVVQVDYHLSCKAPDGAKWPDLDRHMACRDRKLAAGRGEP